MYVCACVCVCMCVCVCREGGNGISGMVVKCKVINSVPTDWYGVAVRTETNIRIHKISVFIFTTWIFKMI